MARFDVYRFRSRATPLVVDVQADVLSDLASRVVVPLVTIDQAEKEVLARLKPAIRIAGNDYILMTTDLRRLRSRASALMSPSSKAVIVTQ